MNTIRDTAFGKLVRLFSWYRWMKYPEEQDPSVWTEYLKPENETKEEEAHEESSMPVNENENPEDLEAFGLYTVMSQVSTRSRHKSSVSTTQSGSADPSRSAQPLVISWRGPDDPEVSHTPFLVIR